ncbi:Ras-specific guanine nucleotide-releasing factor 2 [Thelohanellus kitauei]|uniref:Ras-specific guanine nucleotide-releasing factor 2 n=1 Tax=Thelohanellus kitauei TaxID=669202 RepID=A0A0C2MNV0_THEKT|nr:Ras-specific guanine nucleotide-releasing factor 2 [Thelohanellus kitauei]
MREIELTEFNVNEPYFYDAKEGSLTDFSFDSLDSKSMAMELTKLSTMLHHNLNIREFLSKSWNKKTSHELAPSIMKIIDNFNKTTILIQTSILYFEKLIKRASIIEYWLEVANHLSTLRNYNVMLMIHTAFAANCIYRLKKTWDKVSKKHKEIKTKIAKLCSPNGNYSNLRAEYQKEKSLPYLGSYLSEFMYIDEFGKLFQNENYVELRHMRSMSRVLRSISKSMNYDPKPTKPEIDIVSYFL